MRKSGIFATGAALAAVTMSAQAGIKLSATREAFLFSYEVPQALPLNNAGATSLNFNLATNKKMVLTYSAACAAGGDSGWTDIDIVVNGLIVVPTAGLINPFCVAKVPSTVLGSITVPIQGVAGNNTVRIVARKFGSGGYISIGNSSLVIFD